jgi:acyl-coenzyme A thioesterase PaaI-like protein
MKQWWCPTVWPGRFGQQRPSRQALDDPTWGLDVDGYGSDREVTASATPASGETLVVYSHIGPSSARLTDHTAEGRLHLRPDIRLPHGLLAGPLAILLLDCASKNTRFLARSAPTRVDVDVWDPATDVDDVKIRGRVLRAGRSQIFLDAVMEDERNPNRVIGYGMTCFAVSGPAVETASSYGQADHPAPADDDTPRRPLTEVFEGTPTPDGGFDIPELSPTIGVGRLHSGIMQVLAEAASHEVVRRNTGASRVLTQHLGTSVATGGRTGPFSVVPQLLGVAGGSAGCRVEVVDRGADGMLVATISVSVRVLDDH